jgi:hypothetical protein
VVTDNNSNTVVEGISANFMIKDGFTSPQSLIFSRLNYTNDKYKEIIYKSRGNLPPGQYQINIILVDRLSNEEVGEQTISEDVELLNPPVLVDPLDKSELENINPNFVWLPPYPVSPALELTYKIKIVEIQSNQNPYAAINNNPIWFTQQGIKSQNLIYSVSARQFIKEKHYAWQIEAYAGGIYIGQTEVWEFTFAKKVVNNPKPANYNQSYAVLKKNGNESYYLVINNLKFKFDEEYNQGILDVKILDPHQKEMKLEKEKYLKNMGSNKYEIDFYNNLDFISGNVYTLEVINAKNEKFKLNFKFIRKNSE